jgi:hypothetical protein
VPLTIAENRVDGLQDGLRAWSSSLTRLETLEEERRVPREAVEQVMDSIYNATLYDPEGVRDDAR